MKPVKDQLEERISAVIQQYATGAGTYPAIVRPATEAKFGDYQANGVMALAKKLKTNPRKLAEEIVNKLDSLDCARGRLSDICEKPEVAGPGFINLRLKADFVAECLLKINKDPTNLGVEKTAESKTVVVDFSCPNIAKQMHVGHLRSTIIGDCICRVLEFLGHKVIRQNHIGDWGTQFGMLIAYLERRAGKKFTDAELAGQIGPIGDMELLYKSAKAEYDKDAEFAETARKHVVNLHKREFYELSVLEYIISESRKHYMEIYRKLGVTLEEKDERGESSYSQFLPSLVTELRNKGLAKYSDDALCVFPPDSTGSPQAGFKNKEGQPLPFMIQKSDGAYLYATTDLAALRYRVNQLKADAIIYVTDARQKLHFEMLFAVAEMAGWDIKQKSEDSLSGVALAKTESQKTELVHVTFGSVLGEDGTPLKTRSGENVKLKELLDEAVQCARTIVEEKNPDLDKDKKAEIAKAVGIGAVKYADFSNNRTSDYIFSFDKMLAMDGNTAPYMQYAYARIKSIERKAVDKGVNVKKELEDLEKPSLSEMAELDLAKYLIRYGEAIGAAIADYRPNYLTSYLYELAQKFSVFYTNCPVLDAGPDKRPTRLLLCDLTAKTIKHGLKELLGIEVIEQM